jgi:hypothetical protein
VLANIEMKASDVMISGQSKIILFLLNSANTNHHRSIHSPIINKTLIIPMYILFFLNKAGKRIITGPM